MTRLRLALRRLRQEESGLSLVELLVSGLLTVALLVMVGTMMVQMSKITMASNETTRSNNVASNIANEITTTLRVASTIPVSGGAASAIVPGSNKERIEFYTLSNAVAAAPVAVKVTIWVDAARDVWITRCTGIPQSSGLYTYTTCANTETRKIGGPVSVSTSADDQLFTYYNSATPNPAVVNPTTDTIARTVASVRVYVSVKADTYSGTKKVVINNRVVLGNLGLDNG